MQRKDEPAKKKATGVVAWLIDAATDNAYSNANNVRDTGMQTFKQLESNLAGVVAFIQDVARFIDKVAEKSDGADDDLKDFTKQLRVTINCIKEVIGGISSSSIPRSEILNRVNALLIETPKLFEAIQNLDLGELASGLPTSVKELSDVVSQQLFNLVEELLPVYILEASRNVSDAMLTVDARGLDKFAKLTPVEQDGILFALHEMHIVLRNFVLVVDKLETKFSMKSGTIFTDEEVGALIRKIQGIFRFPVEIKTLDQLFAMLSKAYEMRMERAGYTLQEEVYPFTKAKLVSRLAHFQKIRSKLESFKITDEEKQSIIWSGCESYVNGLIAESLSESENENGVFTFKKDRIERANALGALQRELAKQNGRLDLVIAGHAKEYKGAYEHTILKELIKKIEESISKSKAKFENRIAKRQKEQTRIRRRIDDIRGQVVGVDENDSLANPYQQSDDELRSSFINLLRDSYNDVAEFMPEAIQLDQKSKSEKSALTTIQDSIGKVEAFLKNTIDQGIFDQYFVTLKPDSAHPLSWAAEAGVGFMQLKSAVAQLKELQTEFQAIEGGQGKRCVSDSPQANHIRRFALADACRKTVLDLGLTAQRLKDNPFLLGCITELKTLSTFALVKRKFNDHHLVKFALNDGKKIIIKSFKSDRFETLLGDLNRFYAYASGKFHPDKVTESKVILSISALQGLSKNFRETLSDEDVSTMDYIAFAMRHFGEIIKVLPNLGQLQASLTNYGKKEALYLAAEINAIIKSIYLFADELEIASCLQEGYIVNHLKIGDKSLQQWVELAHQEMGNAGFEFNPEDRFPYVVALNARRTEQAKMLKGEVVKAKESIDRLHGERATHLDALRVNGVKAEGVVQDASILVVNKMKVMIQLGDLAVGGIRSIIGDKKNALPDSESDRYGINELKMLIENSILPQLIRESHHKKYALMLLKQESQPYSSIVVEKIADLEGQVSLYDEKIAAYRDAIEDLHKEIIYTKMPADYKRSESIEQLICGSRDALASIAAAIEAFRKHKPVADAVSAVERLRALDGRVASRIDRQEYSRLRKQLSHVPDCNASVVGVLDASSGFAKSEMAIRRHEVSLANLMQSVSLLEKRASTNIPTAVLPVDNRRHVMVEMDIQYQELINQRKKFFFFGSNRLSHERQIAALGELRERYQIQGYTLSAARQDVKADLSTSYNVFKTKQQPFIRHLKQLDSAISPADRGNVVVAAHIQHVSVPDTDAAMLSKIDMRISKLDQEARSIFYLGKVKDIKIKLLGDLKAELVNKSFADAVKIVRSKHESTFHWLFEGKTGRMMHEIELSTYSQDKVIHMIDVEIARLKNIKLTKPGLFASRSKRDAALDERIAALLALRDNNFDLSRLTAKQQAIILKNEKSLLADIALWQESKGLAVTAIDPGKKLRNA